jgi:hypothetical protein
MRNLVIAAALSAVSATLALWACGSDPQPPGSPSGMPTQVPDTSGTVVGAAGGTVSAGEATLSVPEGALASDMVIQVTKTDEAVPSEYIAASAVYRFSPDGLVFATPATVHIPFDGPADGIRVFWSTPAGGFEALPTTIAGAVATAQVMHFSSGFAGQLRSMADAMPDPMADAPAESGPDDAAVTQDAESEASREASAGDAGDGATVGAHDAASGDADAATRDADAASDSGSSGCIASQMICFGTCVSTQSDPRNCGGCGVSCAQAQMCSGGVCRSANCSGLGGVCSSTAGCCSGTCAAGLCSGVLN